MHQHYRTKGFVLAKKNSGEADQIFVLYTQDFGKIELVGKAIRKITSKLKAGIDVFYFIEAEFIQGKRQKILIDAILLNKFSIILKDEEKLTALANILQTIEGLTIYSVKDEKVWSLIFESVDRLNNNGNNSKIILHYFLWNFFKLLGFAPELYFCSMCLSSLLPETFFLSPFHGGVVCWKCCKKAKQENHALLVEEISVNEVKLIRFLIKEPFEKSQKLIFCQNDLQKLDKAFDLYFNFLSQN